MNKTILLYTLLFCTFFILPSFTQQANYTNEILIKNLVEYRDNEIISKSVENQLFNGVIKRWCTLEPDHDKLEYFLFNCQYSKTIKNFDFDYIQDVSKEKTNNSPLSRSFTEDELKVVLKKVVFLLLINHNVFDIRYPYKIKNNSIFRELEFYDLEENDIVADIGSGQGIFSLMVYFSKSKLKIYTNEIKEELLNFIDVNIAKHINNPETFITVKGSKKSTELPEKADKIILRNTYHHLDKKRKMMKSIKSTLKESGELLIKESLRSNNETECDKRMSEFELKSEIKKFGFKIIDELILDENIYLKLIVE